MAKTTSNKSLRLDEPTKAMRRQPIAEGETDESNRAAGADGAPRRGRRRPGRAASLLSSRAQTRSQRWRTAGQGDKTMRRGNLAKGSHTSRRSPPRSSR